MPFEPGALLGLNVLTAYIILCIVKHLYRGFLSLYDLHCI